MSDDTEIKYKRRAASANSADDKRACLIMIKGDFIGQIFELSDVSTILGRSDDADVVLIDTRISRKHARIEHRSDKYLLDDLDSTNGTWLNGERVTRPRTLYEGDKIRLDNIVLKFSFQDDDDAAYHRQMRNMAVKDDLTRIFNKRYFHETLEKEFAYVRRNDTSLVLILIDIDHFKHINDSLGHPAGDNVLRQFAQLLVKGIRGYDLFARCGGEEFAFLLKGVTLEESLVFAQRVRRIVEKHTFDYDGEQINITVSLGVSCWYGDDAMESVDDLVNDADKWLYQAKNNGRNTVCSATGA